jgi:hypothetical protein
MAERLPTAADVWEARKRRAQQRGGPDLVAAWIKPYHELLDTFEWQGNVLVLVRPEDNRRLWAELGEILGIGPPPN